MEKRRTTFFYVAAFFLIVGIGSFIMPLFGRQVIIFRWLGDFTLIGQIAFIVLGARPSSSASSDSSPGPSPRRTRSRISRRNSRDSNRPPPKAVAAAEPSGNRRARPRI